MKDRLLVRRVGYVHFTNHNDNLRCKKIDRSHIFITIVVVIVVVVVDC